METAKQRIERILNHYHLNPKSLATTLSYSSPQIIYEITNGKTQNVSGELAKRIAEAMPEVNMNWLITGIGEMINSGDDENLRHIIRYYPESNAAAGGNFSKKKEECVIELNLPMYKDCQTAVNVEGISMQPVLMNGEIVLLKEWNYEVIEWGRVYYIVTKDGLRCIKYLFPSKKKDHVSCRSADRTNYPDFDIARANIARLALVRVRFASDFA